MAAHLAMRAMVAGEQQDAWRDLPAAVAVAAEVLDGLQVADDVREAVRRAGVALVETAGLPAPTDEAKAACAAFLPYYAGILRATTWRRLLEAQRATRKAWGQSQRADASGPARAP